MPQCSAARQVCLQVPSFASICRITLVYVGAACHPLKRVTGVADIMGSEGDHVLRRNRCGSGGEDLHWRFALVAICVVY